MTERKRNQRPRVGDRVRVEGVVRGFGATPAGEWVEIYSERSIFKVYVNEVVVIRPATIPHEQRKSETFWDDPKTDARYVRTHGGEYMRVTMRPDESVWPDDDAEHPMLASWGFLRHRDIIERLVPAPGTGPGERERKEQS